MGFLVAIGLTAVAIWLFIEAIKGWDMVAFIIWVLVALFCVVVWAAIIYGASAIMGDINEHSRLLEWATYGALPQYA